MVKNTHFTLLAVAFAVFQLTSGAAVPPNGLSLDKNNSKPKFSVCDGDTFLSKNYSHLRHQNSEPGTIKNKVLIPK